MQLELSVCLQLCCVWVLQKVKAPISPRNHQGPCLSSHHMLLQVVSPRSFWGLPVSKPPKHPPSLSTPTFSQTPHLHSSLPSVPSPLPCHSSAQGPVLPHVAPCPSHPTDGVQLSWELPFSQAPFFHNISIYKHAFIPVIFFFLINVCLPNQSASSMRGGAVTVFTHDEVPTLGFPSHPFQPILYTVAPAHSPKAAFLSSKRS